MSPSIRRRRRWPLLLLALVLLELALQATAPFVRTALSRRDAAPLADTDLTVLCVGDSNTFGLNVPKPWSYPSRLQARLAPRYDQLVSVVNRGVPGHNAAQVARALPADLAEVDPDLVLILVGVNDTWNTNGETSGMGAVLGRLKLVRLVRVLLAGVTNPGSFEVVTDDDGRFAVRRGDEIRRVDAVGSVLSRTGHNLQANVQRWLAEAIGHCRDHGAEPILLTYPESQGAHGTVNQAVREVAARHELTVIDLERRFAVHFAREGYPVLMFNDHHPNLRGYELMAGDVAQALRAAHLVATPRDSPEQVTIPSRPPVMRAVGGGRLELQGPPGWAFLVVVAETSGADVGFSVGPVRIPLANDDILATGRVLPELSGMLDDRGQGTVTIPGVLRRKASGAGLHACLLLLHQPDHVGAESPIAGVSPPIEVRF